MKSSISQYSDPKALAHDVRRQYEKLGYRTATEISKYTGITQSQVHRNLFGTPRRFSKTLRALCKYAKTRKAVLRHDPRTSDALMDALSQVWDGSDEQARKIADMLLAIKDAEL